MSAKRLYMCLTILSLFLAAFGPSDPDIQYVHNLQEFREHTRIHIQNVGTLGMAVYARLRNQYFQDVPPNLLQELLLLHDEEKLASLEELRRLGYTHEKPFDVRLYEYYHTDKNELVPTAKKKFQNLIDELNRIDGRYSYLFLKRNNLMDAKGNLSPVAEKMLLIEKLVDLVDRYKNPVSPEEFDKKEMEDILKYFKVTNQMQRDTLNYALRIYTAVIPSNALALNYFRSQRCEMLFK